MDYTRLYPRVERENDEIPPCMRHRQTFLPREPFLSLHQVLAEYIWLGSNVSNGTDLHNKTRVLAKRPEKATDVEWWTYDSPEGTRLASLSISLYFITLHTYMCSVLTL